MTTLPLPKLTCAFCEHEKEATYFSPSQVGKPDSIRRCKQCKARKDLSTLSLDNIACRKCGAKKSMFDYYQSTLKRGYPVCIECENKQTKANVEKNKPALSLRRKICRREKELERMTGIKTVNMPSKDQVEQFMMMSPTYNNKMVVMRKNFNLPFDITNNVWILSKQTANRLIKSYSKSASESINL